MEMVEISISFNACYTIAFVNHSTTPANGPIVMVCKNKDVYERQLSRLKTLSWIQVVQNGPSVFAQ